MRLALLDLDGTLLAGPSSEQLFILHLLRNRILGPRQGWAAAGFLWRYSGRYGRHVWRKDKAYLSGLDAALLVPVAAAFVRNFLISRLRPAMLERLRRHQRDGDIPILLTGTLDLIAGPLANHLGISHWCATICAQRHGRFMPQPPERHPFGREKLALASCLAEQLGLALADATAYADSRHDLPLLEAVAHPVAVNPAPGLARAAHRRGWEVLTD
ncbi:MAG: HAD family hydrolase [Gammaproteobacteria bacterium]|nr:haloacid dehalogenase-like hydrolase [Gammaproteobacteria bacterium]